MQLDFGPAGEWMLFGNGSVLLELLDRLLENGRRVIVVGGERHLSDEVTPGTTMRAAVLARSVRLIETEDVNTDADVIAALTPDTIGVSFDAPWIFKRAFIDRFAGKLINSHGARLPQDRGGGGFSWRLLQGERLGYSVLHQVLPKVDAGPIVAIREFLYPASCRVPQDYFDFTFTQDLAFIRDFASTVCAGEPLTIVSQPEYLSFYWPRLYTDVHGWIDWSWSARQVENFVCAFDTPYKGSRTTHAGTSLRLKDVYATTKDGTFHPFQSGMIYRKSAGALFIACTDGALIVNSVTDDDGNDLMPGLRVGERFYTLPDALEQARRYRASYNAYGLVPPAQP